MSETEHMKRRHKAHGSIRKAAEEFGVSKSAFHRRMNKTDENEKYAVCKEATEGCPEQEYQDRNKIR